MTTEAEKAVKDKLKEMARALFPFAGSVTWDADMVRKEMGDVLTIGHVMGAASRDGEVAKLEARVKELEKQSEWVPVSENLPGREGLYLVTTGDGGLMLAMFNPHMELFEIRLVIIDWISGGITAWRPLPEQFKGKPNDHQK
jgi:hypothetical protein